MAYLSLKTIDSWGSQLGLCNYYKGSYSVDVHSELQLAQTGPWNSCTNDPKSTEMENKLL